MTSPFYYFEAPQRSVKIKILSYIFLFVRDQSGKGQGLYNLKCQWRNNMSLIFRVTFMVKLDYETLVSQSNDHENSIPRWLVFAETYFHDIRLTFSFQVVRGFSGSFRLVLAGYKLFWVVTSFTNDVLEACFF